MVPPPGANAETISRFWIRNRSCGYRVGLWFGSTNFHYPATTAAGGGPNSHPNIGTHFSCSHQLPVSDSAHFPVDWQGDLLVAFHGSWNRSVPTGYKVVRLKVEGDRIVGEEDFISGWLLSNGSSVGRPVDLILVPKTAHYTSRTTKPASSTG